MGSCHSKCKNNQSKKDVEGLKGKIRLLQSDINKIMCLRESESQAYKMETMVFAFKEAEWKQERKKLKEEVKKLSKRIEETEEEKKKGMEGEMVAGKSDQKWSNCLLKHIMEERAVRDEAIKKWKQLYLAIKIELDDLIERTNQGKELYLKAQEEELSMVELQREMEAKVETIKLLQTQITSLEQENSKMKREMDILRQSLRIMSHKKKPTNTAKGLSKRLNL